MASLLRTSILVVALAVLGACEFVVVPTPIPLGTTDATGADDADG